MFALKPRRPSDLFLPWEGHAHAMERRYHASRLGGFEVYDEFVRTGWSAG